MKRKYILTQPSGKQVKVTSKKSSKIDARNTILLQLLEDFS